MELRNNPNVFFEPVSHSYECNGKLLLGVTELLSKHNLNADYNGIPDKVLNTAAKKGSELHKRIEDYDNQVNLFADEFIDSYIKVCQENGLKFLVNELLISDEELVASMIDGVYEGSKPNYVRLVDYKSTQKIHWRALSWQLSLYRTLFERQFPGVKVESLHVLHMDKKTEKVLGLYPVEPIPEEEVDALLDCERNGQIYVDSESVPSAELVLNDTELTAYVNSYSQVLEFKEKVAQAEAVLKDFDAKILDYMTKNAIEEMECPGGIKFKVKKAYETTRVDSKALKANFPAIYEKCKTTSVTKASLLVSKKDN